MKDFKLPELSIEHIFDMELKQNGDVLIENDGEGEVLLSPIVGGQFEGKRITGKVMPIGTQFCLEKKRYINNLNCTLLLKTDDCEQVFMTYKGSALFNQDQQTKMKNAEYVDPNEYYYRYFLEFKTGSKKYNWLNNKCCFAIIGVKDWETVYFKAYMVN